MNITRDILQEFKAITSNDVERYIANAISFLSFSYNKMVDFYSGKTSSLDQGVFSELELLERQTQELFATYHSFSGRLANGKWWDLLEVIENIDSRLQTARNINKWSKSSISKVGYNPAMQIGYVMRPNQTVERISQDILRNANPNDEWSDIAIANGLREEDYTKDGGAELKLSFSAINRGVNIQSVVDVMVDKNIYGKDIDRNFGYDTVEEDIKVLSPDDTIFQAVSIMSNLKQNDNPDYPTDGLQGTIIAGNNRTSLNFPIINRQLASTFSTDDSFQNFTIDFIEIKGTALTIDFTVNTRLNESIPRQVIV